MSSVKLPNFTNLINNLNIENENISLPPISLPHLLNPYNNSLNAYNLNNLNDLNHQFKYPLSPPTSETKSSKLSPILSCSIKSPKFDQLNYQYGDEFRRSLTHSSQSSQDIKSELDELHSFEDSKNNQIDNQFDNNGKTDDKIVKKKTKPRKKRQCQECNQFFSNLATHKSTHLKINLRPHVCSICNRGFARPNDLIRHTKRHWKEIGIDKGQFKCPFHKNNKSHDDVCENTTTHQDREISSSIDQDNCHSTGIFSRCDTFKNHLKALHFSYPIGTKKLQRSIVDGHCKECGLYFNNVDDWLANHIDNKKCGKMV